MKKKKLLGVDLDGVCFYFTKGFSDWLEEKVGVSCKPEDITHYYWHHCISGLDEKVFWEEFHKFGESGGYEHLELIPGALEALKILYDRGVDLVYITKRPKYAAEQTERALKKHNFPLHSSLIVTEDKKSPHINEIGVTHFIDDSPSVAEDIVKNTNAKLYLFDYPYNKDVCQSIERVSDWRDLLTKREIYSER